MKSIVQYSFSYTVEHMPFRWTLADQEAEKLIAYLAERGIIAKTRNNWLGVSFEISHKSPQHRIATELIMSGCPLKCSISMTEVEL